MQNLRTLFLLSVFIMISTIISAQTIDKLYDQLEEFCNKKDYRNALLIFEKFKTEILKQFVHSKSQEDIIREYQSDPEKGLTPEEAALRLEALGRNVISEDKKKNLWLIFLSQSTGTRAHS